MAEHDVGDRVILKDDGQVYRVVGVRTEDRVVLYDLEQGDERVSEGLRCCPVSWRYRKLILLNNRKLLSIRKKSRRGQHHSISINVS